MRLYAITDRRLLPGTHESGRLSDAERDGLVRLAKEWAELGAEYVQLREKDLGQRELTDLAAAMIAVFQRTGETYDRKNRRWLFNTPRHHADITSSATPGNKIWTSAMVSARAAP